MAELKPIENQWFRSQRNRAKQAYELGTQQNKYEKGLWNKQQTWTRDDLVRQFNRQRETLANPYNRRGMMNSGMYQQGLLRHYQDRGRALDRQSLATLWKNEGFDLAQSQLARVRDDQLADLKDQQDEYRKTLAGVIDLYRP